jgi:hypothetical protein
MMFALLSRLLNYFNHFAKVRHNSSLTVYRMRYYCNRIISALIVKLRLLLIIAEMFRLKQSRSNKNLFNATLF